MAAEISSDVDSEAPTDTKIRLGVSRKKSQLREWRAEISSDVDSEAPAVTKKQVGVSSVATEGRTEVGLSFKEIVLLTKILVSEHVTITVTLNRRSVMTWLHR